MKTTAKIFLLLLLVGIVSPGCKKLLNVDFDADFKANMNVSVPPTSLKATSYFFDETEIIDPTSDADYKKYADKIVGLEVKSVTGTVTSISKPVTLVTGTIEVSKTGFTTVSWTVTNTPIVVGTSMTLADTDGQFSDLEAILKDTNPITVRYYGETDQDDVDFTYEITFSTTVTANPL